jgi:hypothetical protein
LIPIWRKFANAATGMRRSQAEALRCRLPPRVRNRPGSNPLSSVFTQVVTANPGH